MSLIAVPTSANASKSLPFQGQAFDDLLSSQLAKMSIKERSDGMNDLHGVADEAEETEELLKRSIQDMDLALDKKCTKLPPKDTEAFLKAIGRCSEYVDKRKVQFLRAHGYDTQEAANGILRYFTRKLELFGLERLVKVIQLEDLNEGAVTALRNGLFQLLDQRDRAGRAILFFDAAKNDYSYSTKDVLHAEHYAVMAMLRDEETQKKGTVVVDYANDQKLFVPGRSIEIMISWKALPLKVRGFHYCVKSKEVHFTIYPFCRLMENRKICRFRMHTGSHMENVYKLMTFGIPNETIPVAYDGYIDPAAHNVILKLLQPNEDISCTEKDVSSPPVLVPGPMDILLGRGLRPYHTPGGLRMRHLLEENRELYDNSSKSAKSILVDNILEQLKGLGCRFRKSGPGGYAECDDSVSRNKISHAFRHLRSRRSISPVATKKRKAGKLGSDASTIVFASKNSSLQ